MAKRGRQTLTNAEMVERHEFTAKLLSRRLYHGDVVRLLTARYKVTHATCDAYIRAARAILVSWTDMPVKEHRINSLAFWEGIVRSDATLKERMDAQVRIEKLLGLEAPTVVENRVKMTKAEDLSDEELDAFIGDNEDDDAGDEGEASPVHVPPGAEGEAGGA